MGDDRQPTHNVEKNVVGYKYKYYKYYKHYKYNKYYKYYEYYKYYKYYKYNNNYNYNPHIKKALDSALAVLLHARRAD